MTVGQHDGHAALRPAGVALVGGALGDDDGAQPAAARFERRRETGDARTDDDQVGGGLPRGAAPPSVGRAIVDRGVRSFTDRGFSGTAAGVRGSRTSCLGGRRCAARTGRRSKRCSTGRKTSGCMLPCLISSGAGVVRSKPEQDTGASHGRGDGIGSAGRTKTSMSAAKSASAAAWSHVV